MMKHPSANHAGLRKRPASRWQAALRSLVLPAVRVHNYRNLHKAMFYEAVCEWDCRDNK